MHVRLAIFCMNANAATTIAMATRILSETPNAYVKSFNEEEHHMCAGTFLY